MDRRGACCGAGAGSTATQTDSTYRQLLFPAGRGAASGAGSGSAFSREASFWTLAEENYIMGSKKGWERRIESSWTNFRCDLMTSAAEMGAKMACQCYRQHPVDAMWVLFYTF